MSIVGLDGCGKAVEGITDALVGKRLVALDERSGPNHIGVQDNGELAWRSFRHGYALLRLGAFRRYYRASVGDSERTSAVASSPDVQISDPTYAECPEVADFCLTQRNMTARDYGRRIGRHEHRTPTFTKNRNSQVPGDAHTSSRGAFGERRKRRRPQCRLQRISSHLFADAKATNTLCSGVTTAILALSRPNDVPPASRG